MAIRKCASDGVNRTYVSTLHCDSSYFPIAFNHLNAQLVKVKNNTVSQCNLNGESQFHCFIYCKAKQNLTCEDGTLMSDHHVAADHLYGIKTLCH